MMQLIIGNRVVRRETEAWATAVLATNPRSWWKLDDTEGTTAVDSVYHPNTPATYIDAVLNQTGAILGGRNNIGVDLSSGSISLNEWPLPTTTNAPFSIMFWVKTTATAQSSLMVSGVPSTGFEFRLEADGTVDFLHNNTLRISSTDVVNDDAWHMVAVTFGRDDESIKYFDLYIDSSLQGSYGAASVDTTGHDIDVYSPNLLDEIVMWWSTLSAAQLGTLYTTAGY